MMLNIECFILICLNQMWILFFFGVILNKNYAYNQLLNAIMPLGRAL